MGGRRIRPEGRAFLCPHDSIHRRLHIPDGNGIDAQVRGGELGGLNVGLDRVQLFFEAIDVIGDLIELRLDRVEGVGKLIGGSRVPVA